MVHLNSADISLDARWLLCPLPVIRLQDRVEQLSPGTTLEVLCTDPGTRSDIPAWCRINGHELLSMRDDDDVIVITVRVGNGG